MGQVNFIILNFTVLNFILEFSNQSYDLIRLLTFLKSERSSQIRPLINNPSRVI